MYICISMVNVFMFVSGYVKKKTFDPMTCQVIKMERSWKGGRTETVVHFCHAKYAVAFLLSFLFIAMIMLQHGDNKNLDPDLLESFATVNNEKYLVAKTVKRKL